MSTKIYDGMRATDRNPFRVQRRIKEVLEPLFLAKFDAALAKALANPGRPWDTVFPTLFPRSSPERARWEAPISARRWEVGDDLYDLIVALQRTASHTFSDLDFGYDAILVPNGHGISHQPLVLVFSEHGGNEYRKALMDAGVTEEYGYWNNSDGPDEMSAAAWAEREKAWSKLNVPSQDGLSIPMPSKVDTAYRERPLP